MRASAYVCFDCRRGVKRAAFVKSDWLGCKHAPRRTEPPRCPGCAAPMLDLGHKFKTPRKNDAKQWEKVRRMVQEGGFRFFHHARTPDTLAEVDSFLNNRGPHARRTTSKSQNARSRPAKLAKTLAGPTYGTARPITPAKRREERIALAKTRATTRTNDAATLYRMPARKRPRKES